MAVDIAQLNRNALLKKVTMGSYTFWALISEAVEKSSLIVQHNVQDGFPASQFARVLPRSGSLTIVLTNSVKFRILGVSDSATESLDILGQKSALDGIADIRALGKPIRYSSPLETVASVVIEKISYQRDKSLNVWGATVSWKEIRVTKNLVSALVLSGNIDPATEVPLDAPLVLQGDRVTALQSTTLEIPAGTGITPQYLASITKGNKVG